MKYSILIPVYNAANYIERSIKSALNQKSIYDYEIIICDDGSTDKTLSIINNFNDDKIKVIKNNINKGGIITRKKLAIESKGEYLIWLDADDQLSLEFLSTMDEYVKNSQYDIIDASFNFINKNNEIQFADKSNVNIRRDNLLELFFSMNWKWYLWSKAIKRDVFVKHLPPDYNFPIDDVFFVIPMYYYSQNYLSLNDKALYNYYWDIGAWSSICNKKKIDLKKFISICKARQMEFKYNLSFLIEVNQADIYERMLMYQCDFNSLLMNLIQIEDFKEREIAMYELQRYMKLQLVVNI